MPKPCGNQHQRAVAVRESSDNSGSSSDLADYPSLVLVEGLCGNNRYGLLGQEGRNLILFWDSGVGCSRVSVLLAGSVVICALDIMRSADAKPID
jgi:hypothetical protein